MDVSALEKIKTIFDLRDKLVHAKPELVELNSSEMPKGKSAQSKIELVDKGNLICNLNEIYDAIFKIDKEKNDDHIKEPWLCRLQKRDKCAP